MAQISCKSFRIRREEGVRVVRTIGPSPRGLLVERIWGGLAMAVVLALLRVGRRQHGLSSACVISNRSVQAAEVCKRCSTRSAQQPSVSFSLKLLLRI